MIDLFNLPLFSDPIDEFLFDQILDPILPGQGLPIPLPVRLAAFSVELQYDAGVAIAEGKVANKDQYTGQTSAKDNAEQLGYNLVYQPGGMKI